MSSLDLNFSCSGDAGFQLAVETTLPGKGITAIYGSSGSGKTTLLDCVAGLRPMHSGAHIKFRDFEWASAETAVPSWQRRIGYVFSDARLFPHINVRENLMYGQDRAACESQLSVDEVSERLGLQNLLAQQPDNLSAGQKQRVAIARALLAEPQLMLLDEPCANLDARASWQIQQYLQQLSETFDLPMLYVSHNIEELSQLADYLVFMSDGRIVDQGPLIELCGKLHTHVAHDEHAAAILETQVVEHDKEYGLTLLQAGSQPIYVSQLPAEIGSAHRVRVPARDVSIARSKPSDSSILNVLPVTVLEHEALDASRVMLRLGLDNQFLLARITRKSAEALNITTGDTVYAQIKSVALIGNQGESA